MHRAVYALMAMLSILATNVLPTQAQSDPGAAVNPQASPTVIDEVVKTSGATSAQADSDRTGEYVLPAGNTVDNVCQQSHHVVIEGRVLHDVLAINCDVVVKPGAEVGGYIDVVGGTVENQAGDAVRVIHQSAGLLSDLGGLKLQGEQTVTATSQPLERGEWPGSQFFLAVAGMLAGLILFVVGPRATQRTSDIVAIERGRSMAIGLIGAAIIAIVMLCGGILLHTPLRVLAAPCVGAVALVCAAAVAFGWLCGMAHVGEFLQIKFRRRAGGWYAQMAWGVLAFFALNSILGTMSPMLGGIGTFFEAVFALMGLGAAIISGFGSDNNWLSLRLNHDASWFSRGARR